MTGALTGQGVLVTRPRERSEGLCRRLEALGARVVALPTIAIEPLDDVDTRQRAMRLLPRADRIVFVSPAAVEAGLALLRRAGVAIHAEARVAAVGHGTAVALSAAGWRVDDAPEQGAGAEALLAAGLHRVAGERVVVVRGENGREQLAAGLRVRGAEVLYLEVYRRVLPAVDTAAAAAGWREGWLRFTLVTSATGLDHLLRMLDPAAGAALRRTRVVTVSLRLAAAVRHAGFAWPAVVADSPADAALAAAFWRAAAEAVSERERQASGARRSSGDSDSNREM